MKRNEMSMGCQVEALECSICGLVGSHVHKHDRVFLDGDEVLALGSRFLPTSMVPAPHCPACRTEMRYLASTDWTCSNLVCVAYGKPITTGIGGLVGMVAGPEAPDDT